jgi:HEAT repeat protein
MGRSSDQWIADLSSDVVETRRKAAGVLGWIGQEAISPLVEALRDRDSTVRERAAASLGELGLEALPALMLTLQSNDSVARAGAVHALSHVGVDASPALFQLLRESSVPEAVKEDVLNILCSTGSASIPHLLDAMNEPKTRFQALTVIRKLGTESVPGLLECFESAGRGEPALEALVQLGAPGLPRLIQALSHESLTVRKASALTLGKLKSVAASAVSDLRKAYRDHDPGLRAIILLAFQSLKDQGRSAFPEITRALKDKDDLVRFCGASAALHVRGSPPDLMGYLERSVNDPCTAVRHAATLAILKRQPKQQALLMAKLIDALEKPSAAKKNWASRLASDWDQHVGLALPFVTQNFEAELRSLSKQASRFFSRIEAKTIPLLFEQFEKSSAKKQELLRESLHKLGPQTIPALIDAFKEDSPVNGICVEVFEKLGDAALPALKRAYKDASQNNDEERCLTVVRAYSVVGGRSLSELLAALVDKNERIRRSAADALGSFKGDSSHALPLLIKALRDKVAAVRRTAAKALGAMGDSALPALKQALLHRDRRMRQGAIYALKKLDPSGQIALIALEETLSDPRWYIRRSALLALGRLKGRASPLVARLVPFLDDRDARIRLAAAEALAQIAPQRAVSALNLLMEALGNAAIRKQASEALEKMGLYAAAALVEATENPALKQSATDILWRIGSHSIPGLLQYIASQNESTPADVKLDGPMVVTIVAKLQSPEPGLRAFAAWALGSQGQAAQISIPDLIKAFCDPCPKVRIAASIALGQMGSKAIPALLNVLGAGDADMRPAAVGALGRIESNDLAVANGLLKRLKDSLIGPEESHEISLVLSQMISRAQGAKAIPNAIQVLEKGNPHARKAIISALANAGPRAIPALLLAVESRHVRARQGCISALRQIHERSIGALIRCLGSPKHRHAAALALGLKSEPWIVRKTPPRLIKLLDQESQLLVDTLIKALSDVNDRPWIVRALVSIGPAAVPQMVRCLRSEVGDARDAVALALANASPILSAAVIPILAKSIRANDAELCRTAALTLGGLGHCASPILLETLQELAQDPKVTVRKWAMVALGEMDSLGLPLLIEGLRDEHPKVKQSAAYALRGLGARAQEAYDLLLKHLDDENEYVRWRAAEALGRLFEESHDLLREAEETIPILIEKLLDSSAKVVQGAALALVRIGPMAVAQLSSSLSSEHENIRRWASWALGKIGANVYSPEIKDAVLALCSVLRDKDPSIAQSAAWALGKIGADAREAAPALKKSLSGGHPGLRWFATFALGAIGREARTAMPELEQGLLDADEDVQREAAFALARISSSADDKVLPVLINALKAKVALRDTSFRRRALEALEALGPKTTPHLFQALKSSHSSVRYGAAIILAKVSPLAVHAVLPILLDALQSQDNDMKPGAVEALGILGFEAKASIPLLLASLESEIEAVRTAAIKALSLIVPKPEQILGALADTLEDKSPEVRRLAAETLGRLGKHTRENELRNIMPRLIVGLWDENDQVNEQVTITLGELGRPAVQSLITVLSNKDPQVARRAVVALVQIGLEAIPALLKSLASSHVWTRLRAAEAMTDIWPVASVAIPDILESLQSEDIWVRQNALRLIEATSIQLTERQNKARDAHRPMHLGEAERPSSASQAPMLRSETFVFEDLDDDEQL